MNQQAESFFVDGMKHYLLGNYQEAQSYFNKAHELSPDNAGLNYMLAKIASGRDKYEEALNFIQKAIKADNKNKYYYLLQAQIHERRLNYPEATKVYKKLLAEIPGTEEYLYDLAAVYLYQNNFDEAVKTYNKVEQVFGKSPEVSRQKQQILLQNNKLDQALAEGESLIAAFPDVPEYKLRQAEMLYSNNRVAESLKLLEKLVADDPENSSALLMLSEVYRFQGKYELSMLHLERVILHPETALNTKVNLLEEFKRLPPGDPSKEKAVGIAESVKKNHPDEAAAYTIYGDLLYLTGKKYDAWENYLKAKTLDPGNFNLWNQILMLDSELNKPDSMVLHSEQALETFPNQAVFWLFNGAAHLIRKNYREAADALEEGKKLTSGNAELKKQFSLQLGDAYNSLKEFTKSDAAFEEVLKTDSRNAHALNNYAYFLALRKEKLEYAKSLGEKLIRDNPNEPSYLDTFAWVLYMLKDYEGARKLLEKAAAASNNGTIIEHYGDVLFRLGEKDKALQQWKKASELGDASEFIHKKIQDQQLYE